MSDDVVVLGRTGRWQLIVSCVLMLGVGVVALPFNSGVTLIYGVAAAAVVAYRWGDVVRLEEEALVVVHRGQRRVYPWADCWSCRGASRG